MPFSFFLPNDFFPFQEDPGEGTVNFIATQHAIGPQVQPHFKEHFAAQMQMGLAADYKKITLPATDMHSMALLYQEAINTWLDSEKVSFQTTNVRLAGKLSLKDCFVLHFFSFLCCYRCEWDNCFVLAVTGCSTSGKTVLFENPIMRNAHSFIGEVGVGRYTVGSKSLLLYSDIALEHLLKGNDGEKFKTLARTERTTCKIHSHTEEVQLPLLLLLLQQLKPPLLQLLLLPSKMPPCLGQNCFPHPWTLYLVLKKQEQWNL